MSKPQLFLLHFAGGNSYSFHFLKAYLPEFEFVALELPGRGKRMQENLLRDFDAASEDIYKQILRHLNPGHFMLYGHSMGSVMALKATLLLQEINVVPLHLVVSGNPGPGVGENKGRYLMEKETLKLELKEMGGMPDEVLTNDELFEFYEPILKADFEVVEKNSPVAFSPVRVPICAIMGSEEKRVGDIDNWRKYTHSYFESKVLDGGHFFIYQHPRKIADIIRDCYNRNFLC